MLGLHWTQADVDQVSPERRARLLFALYAQRVVDMRTRILSQSVSSNEALASRTAAATELDLELFPMDR